MGLLAAVLWQRYHRKKLVDWLGFFNGRRLVPIIMAFVGTATGVFFGLVWEPIGEVISDAGEWITGLGAAGAGLFGLINRALIPIGMHQFVNTVSWFQIGDFTNAAGEVVHGDLNRFFAGDPDAGDDPHAERGGARGERGGQLRGLQPAVAGQPARGEHVADVEQRQRSVVVGPYLDRHITRSLINRGYARYSGHWTNLSRIRERYGVEPSVIIAIYGKETSYGSITGTFDLIEALASLAYEGRRRSMFEDEFVAALKLLDAGVRRSTLKGSYAGATGYPQFMPSVALRLRADGDGDGYADIWRSEDDAFASIANYLRDAGWKPNLPWGVPVSVPSNLNRAAIRSAIKPPRCPAVYNRHSRWLTVREWRALGVRPADNRVPDSEMATLMETPGAYAQGYLLTTNYRSDPRL